MALLGRLHCTALQELAGQAVTTQSLAALQSLAIGNMQKTQ